MTTPTGSKEEMEGRSQSQPSADAGPNSPRSHEAQSAAGKHTPGPWLAASRPSSIVGLPVVATSNGRSIASVTFFSLGAEFASHDRESLANAHLIAAAPDLLEALKAVVANVRDYERVNNLAPNPGRANCWDSVTTADAAIAKATGTDPLPPQPRDPLNASLKSREEPLPSREELERALREIAEESVFSAQRFAEDTDTDYFLRWIKALKDRARAALTSKEQNNG